ncbi:5'-fluoro-5'-deoxy-adenosine synthase [bacterium HR20]|nr:5'-fluoro-5'-deoxy-adenosine synthase [bacterium HR20]
MASAPIFLLTDFGDRDAYVGVMKAVMLGIEPMLRVVDLCHNIEPQNVVSASYVLLTAVPYLPRGSVVVAVVDPGVGTKRRIVALAFEQFILLAPDNGIATLVLDRFRCERAVAVEHGRVAVHQPSATFHGRDVFAPAAAYLASGQLTLEQLGETIEVTSLVQLALEPRSDGQVLHASVLHVDRFGNLVTNVEAPRWGIAPGGKWYCCIGDCELPILRTYGEQEPGQALAYIGSSGFIEIAVRNGSAAEQFGNAPAIILIRQGDTSTSPETSLA